MLSAATRIGPTRSSPCSAKAAWAKCIAVKVLPSAFSADPERSGRFQREAQALAALSHPNSAAIYGFEQSGSVRASSIRQPD
jgi:serine/threonine protein kinase